MKLLEKIGDKIFDICPCWLYICYQSLKPRAIKNKLKWFYQRHTRGWDDRELWDLEISFFKWLSSRLKRLHELNNGFPDTKTFEEHQDEILKMSKEAEKQANMIYDMNDEDFDFDEYTKRKKELLDWFVNELPGLWL